MNKTIMESIVFILLAILLTGDRKDQRYILDHVKTEYFEEKAHAEIFKAAAKVNLTEEINLVSVKEALTTDENKDVIIRRLSIFREYFIRIGDLVQESSSDDEVRHQISLLVVNISTNLVYRTPVDVATQFFVGNYVGRAKRQVMLEYQAKLKDCPTVDFTDELNGKLKALDALLKDNTWKNYVIDFFALEKEPEEIALILRKGQGFFYRGNIYLISGYAGAMKSFLCLAIAAAASNKGIKAERTLSFCSTTEALKVLYVDTELARNTVRKRWRSLKMMSGEEFDHSRFNYLSLRMVSGDIKAKMHIFDSACRQFKPDFIVIDSGRDLCLDFNDNREADGLVSHFKQIATDLNAVVLSTSHKSLGNGNAKGHFGMRFNEAAGLELSLTKVTDGNETYVKVEFPKQREDLFEPFAFKYNPDSGWLIEHAPTVDHAEESRQYRAAKAAVEKVLRPGQFMGYNDLMRKLISETVGSNGKPISERTAKNYISVLSGTVLTCNPENRYSLVDPDAEIPFDDDLPN